MSRWRPPPFSFTYQTEILTFFHHSQFLRNQQSTFRILVHFDPQFSAIVFFFSDKNSWERGSQMQFSSHKAFTIHCEVHYFLSLIGLHNIDLLGNFQAFFARKLGLRKGASWLEDRSKKRTFVKQKKKRSSHLILYYYTLKFVKE